MMAGKTNQTTVAGLKKRLVKYHIFLHLSAWSSNRQPPPHQDPLPTQPSPTTDSSIITNKSDNE